MNLHRSIRGLSTEPIPPILFPVSSELTLKPWYVRYTSILCHPNPVQSPFGSCNPFRWQFSGSATLTSLPKQPIQQVQSVQMRISQAKELDRQPITRTLKSWTLELRTLLWEHLGRKLAYLRCQFNNWKLDTLVCGQFLSERLPPPCIFDTLFNTVFCCSKWTCGLAKSILMHECLCNCQAVTDCSKDSCIWNENVREGQSWMIWINRRDRQVGRLTYSRGRSACWMSIHKTQL